MITGSRVGDTWYFEGTDRDEVELLAILFEQGSAVECSEEKKFFFTLPHYHFDGDAAGFWPWTEMVLRGEDVEGVLAGLKEARERQKTRFKCS